MLLFMCGDVLDIIGLSRALVAVHNLEVPAEEAILALVLSTAMELPPDALFSPSMA